MPQNAGVSRSPELTPQGWDSVVDNYDRLSEPVTTVYCTDMLRLLEGKPGDHLLDVAAGTGALSLAAASAGFQVTAVDFSPAMIERLQSRISPDVNERVVARTMNGQSLEFPNDTFDHAASNFGAIFFPDPRAGFRELKRVLKPGGRVVISAWGPPDQLDYVKHIQGAISEKFPELKSETPPIWLQFQDPELLVRALTDTGFADVRVETVTRTAVFDSPESFGARLCGMSPAMDAFLSSLTQDDVTQIEERLVRNLHEAYGEGPVPIRSVAHIGVGVA